MQLHKIFALLAAAAGVFLVSCSNLAGPGTGSDTPNSICGTLLYQNETPAPQALVQLIPIGYNPANRSTITAIRTDTTDSNGTYRFDRVPSGSYNILAVHLSLRTRTIVYAVSTVNKNTATAPTGTLLNPGAIRVVLPDNQTLTSGYIYIPGTTFCLTT